MAIAWAARNGLGLALLTKFLIGEELVAGQLIAAFSTTVQSDGQYYFVSPSDRNDYAPLAAFRNWLIEEAARQQPIQPVSWQRCCS